MNCYAPGCSPIQQAGPASPAAVRPANTALNRLFNTVVHNAAPPVKTLVNKKLNTARTKPTKNRPDRAA
jgi:hypothetical protein